MGYFKNPEHEPIRVQKLNGIAARVDYLDSISEAFMANGGSAFYGASGLVLDGGGVTGVADPSIIANGGNA